MRCSEQKAFRLLWLCFLAYSVCFTVLQSAVLTPLDLPEGVKLLACAVCASLPALWYGYGNRARRQTWREGRPMGLARAVYLLSLTLGLNLLVTLTTPGLARLLGRLGLGTRPAAPATPESVSLLLLFYVCVAAPVLEELLYRGVLMRRLLPYGERLAVVISALCFGLMHHVLFQGMAAFLGGLVYGYAAARYSLRGAIGLHIANNSVATLLTLIQESGTAGTQAALALMAAALLVLVVGSLILLLRWKGREKEAPRQGVCAPRELAAEPLFWAVLLFDLIHLGCTDLVRL